MQLIQFIMYKFFEVTMGSYDDAEMCGLVATYLLFLLTNIIDKSNSGLYRDDGLI